MRPAGGKSWLLSTGVLLGALLILAIATRKHAQHAAPGLQANAASAAPSTPNSAKTSGASPAPSSANLANLSLYDSTEENADPKWGQPANLDQAKLRDLAQRLQELKRIYVHLDNGSEALKVNYGELNRLRGVLIDRVSGDGIRDKQIPLLWGRLMNVQGVPAPIQGAAEFAEGVAIGAFQIRVSNVESNILAGSPTVGDTLFVDAATRFFRLRAASVDREVEATSDLCKRLIKEFPEVDLTYFDKDGVKHDQSEAPPALVSAEEVAAMRAAVSRYSHQMDTYRLRFEMNARRKRAIEGLREQVSRSGDEDITEKWAEVVGATSPDSDPNFLNFPELSAPSAALITGRVTLRERTRINEEAAQFQKLLDAANKEHDLQMQFADLLVKEHSPLVRSLRSQLTGNILKIWGHHLEDTPASAYDEEVP